jgi:MFS transporter, ACS family, hexuronate transporter
VSPILRLRFHMSASTYAHLLTIFLLGYTISQFVAGRLADRLGARRGLLLAMLWWSSAGLLAATSNTLGQLGSFLFLMGIGEAANWPTSVRAIREWFPAKRRAVAVGYFNSGSCAGAVLAPIVVSALTLRYSWRVAFAVCGCIGFLWIIPWSLSYSKKTPFGDEGIGPATPISEIFRDRRAWGVILARFFGDPIWYFYIFWLPDYLSRVRGFSLREIGMTAWMPFLAAGIGSFVGGFASGHLIRKGSIPSSARLVVLGLSAAVMVAGTVISYCHGASLTIAIISLVIFAYGIWAANILTLPSDIFPVSAVATVVGASGTGAGLGGMLTMLVAGQVIDHYSYQPVLWGIGMLPLIAFACSLLAARSSRHSSRDTVVLAVM